MRAADHQMRDRSPSARRPRAAARPWPSPGTSRSSRSRRTRRQAAGVGGSVQAVELSAWRVRCRIGQAAADPALGQRRLALRLGQRLGARPEHEAGRVPQLVGEVARRPRPSPRSAAGRLPGDVPTTSAKRSASAPNSSTISSGSTTLPLVLLIFTPPSGRAPGRAGRRCGTARRPCRRGPASSSAPPRRRGCRSRSPSPRSGRSARRSGVSSGQPRVLNGHRPLLNQVSKMSVSWVSSAAGRPQVAQASGPASASVTVMWPSGQYQAGIRWPHHSWRPDRPVVDVLHPVGVDLLEMVRQDAGAPLAHRCRARARRAAWRARTTAPTGAARPPCRSGRSGRSPSGAGAPPPGRPSRSAARPRPRRARRSDPCRRTRRRLVVEAGVLVQDR